MKILVSRLKFIGDIVLTTPVIRALREKFPDSVIDYLGDKEAVSLLESNPYLNHIIPYNFGRWEVAEQLSVGNFLRKRQYDVAIDLFGNPRSAIVIFLSGARMRIGGAFGWRRRTFTHPIKITERMDAVSFHLRYLAPLGILKASDRPSIFLTEKESYEGRDYLMSVGMDHARPIVGMHIGATWPAKVWPAEKFARVADLLHDKTGAQVVVSYGPKDTACAAAFSKAARTKSTIIRPGTLRRLASIISHLDVYVSNDAAPMHISAAVGTPTVGIFGPGEPDIWFPYENRFGHIALKKNVECCRKDICELKGEEYMRCMKQLKAEEVFEVTKDIMERSKLLTRGLK